MADYNAQIAPFINTIFYVTGKYGVQRPTHMHVGLDIATSIPQNLYSMFTGKIIDKGFSNARGYYIIIKDGTSNYASLYQHMESSSPKQIGDDVLQGEFVGIEGTTGQVSGLHLHLEMQILENRDWYFGNDISYYINPATYMGIPNETGISAIYNGDPYVPPEPPVITNNHWYQYKKRKLTVYL